jgi:Skp family chaperone for outer membrane proteins
MSSMKILLAACGLLLAFSASAVQPATAQATTVVVIDEARIFTESLAGKDIQAKLANIETQINNELDPARRALQTDEESIQSRVQGKTPEQVAADEALMTQLQGFERKRNEFAQRRALVSQQFALTERKALADFNTALEPVILEVVRERNAQLVLQKSQVVYNTDAIDVTAMVISKLDARTPAISVTRQQLPAQQQ